MKLLTTKIYIPKGPKLLIYSIMVLLSIIGLLELVGMSNGIEWILDILNICLFISALSKKRNVKIISNPLIFFHIIIIVTGIAVSILNSTSYWLILWAIRNAFRFSAFYMGCVCFLDFRDICRILDTLLGFFWINFAMTLFEFFALDRRGDAIGGIFAGMEATNGTLTVFVFVVTTYIFIRWINKEIRSTYLCMILICDIIISALAELKFFFLMMVLIGIALYISDRIKNHNDFFTIRHILKNLRWIFIISLGVVAIALGIKYLIKIYPHWKGFFSWDSIINETTRSGGYTNRGDFNRLTFISSIRSSILGNSVLKNLFGLGLGACEFSNNSSKLTSAFFRSFQYTHYYYFSLPWMYLECGIFGMVLYITSFLFPGIIAFKRYIMRTQYGREYQLAYLLTAIVSLGTVFFLIYNQSMRLNSAYYVFFCLAATSIVDKSTKNAVIRPITEVSSAIQKQEE